VPAPDGETKSADDSAAKAADAATTSADDSATKTGDDHNAADAAATPAQAAELPVVPRTSTISTTARADADGEAPASSSRGKRSTVDPATLRETNKPADLISLPRTMSEEWMAADADDGAYEVEPRRPRWILAVAGGLAVIGAVAVFAMTRGGETVAPRASAAARSGSGEPTGTPTGAVAAVPLDAASAAAPVAVVAPVVAPVDAAEVAMAPPVVPIDAPPVAAVPVDAMQVAVAPVAATATTQVATTATKPATTPTATKPDAPVATKPVTTPVATTATKPATTPIATKPDAPVATKPATKPDVPATKKPPKEPKAPSAPKDERTIEQLVDAHEFGKANTACTTNTQFSTPRLVACALAACNTHSAALAARWIRAIPRASRDEMVSTCKGLGVDVPTP
jgi:hypothetical protein